MHEGQVGGDISVTYTQIITKKTESREPKITILQLGGAHKKMKVHKDIPQYTIK
jgi:hypothetical protein